MPESRETGDMASGGLFTIEGAAAFLQMSRNGIYALIRSGELTSIKVGKCRRVPRRACEQLIEEKLAAEN